MNKLVVGQKLWFVGTGGGRFKAVRENVTVATVGRKWAQVQGAFNGRIDVATLVVDGEGFAAPGTCYLSREDWMAKEGIALAWRNLRAEMPGSCPANLSYETILQVAQLLGLDASVPGAKSSTDARLARAVALAPAQQFRYAMHALRSIADGVVQPGRYAELAIQHIAGSVPEAANPHPNVASETPQADRLEELRKEMGQARTAPYGDALALCRSLEAENGRLKAALAAQSESAPA